MKSRSVWLKFRFDGSVKKRSCEGKRPLLMSYPVNHVKELGLYAEGKEQPLKDL